MCLKFVKRNMKKCFETNTDVNLALLQIRSTLIGPWLPSPITIIFSRLTQGTLLKINTSPISYDYDQDNYNELKLRQCKLVKKNDNDKEIVKKDYPTKYASQRWVE